MGQTAGAQTTGQLQHAEQLARLIVNELFEQNVISQDVVRVENGAYTIVRPIFGFQRAQAFGTRAEIVDQLVQAIALRWQQAQPGLRKVS